MRRGAEGYGGAQRGTADVQRVCLRVAAKRRVKVASTSGAAYLQRDRGYALSLCVLVATVGSRAVSWLELNYARNASSCRASRFQTAVGLRYTEGEKMGR